MLNRRLPLGRYFGIPLYVHWTFSLLLLAVGLERMRNDGRWQDALLSICIVLTVYLCVTLHEYGHAMMAKAFGVGTRDITLLPIGGVARLERMPRQPSQELLIAVAGPAVNVVIASLLIAGMVLWGLATTGPMGAINNALEAIDTDQITFAGFVLIILLANVALIVFNMIPAFPMDGGRVLRSLLAMVMDYPRATWWASRIGLGCAFLMGGIAILNSYYVMLFIAFFVAWAGMSEARQVSIGEAVRGLKVSQVMVRIPHQLCLQIDQSLEQAAHHWQHFPGETMPVCSPEGECLGMLSLKDLIGELNAGHGAQPVVTIVQRNIPRLSPDEGIDSLLGRLPSRGIRQMPVVTAEGRLIGIVDLDNLMQRAALAGTIPFGPMAVPESYVLSPLESLRRGAADHPSEKVLENDARIEGPQDTINSGGTEHATDTTNPTSFTKPDTTS